jgi:hypothetical protein
MLHLVYSTYPNIHPDPKALFTQEKISLSCDENLLLQHRILPLVKFSVQEIQEIVHAFSSPTHDLQLSLHQRSSKSIFIIGGCSRMCEFLGAPQW